MGHPRGEFSFTETRPNRDRTVSVKRWYVGLERGFRFAYGRGFVSVAIGRQIFDAITQRGVANGFAYSGERLVALLTDPEIVRALAGRKEKP